MTPTPHFPRLFYALFVSTLILSNGGLVFAQANQVDFNRDIRPLLSDRCFVCHGPDGSRREGELRLDMESTAKESVIVPGSADDSELVARVESDDAETIMPPADSKLKLSASEKALLRTWIDQGAKWNQHWAFEPPQKIAPPPSTMGNPWPRNIIDRFVLARMQQSKLSPAKTASRERLIRRLTFDLTGLPPTLQEIDAFLKDREPGAYERVVDRLLKSPAYGERMASIWLDAARYSDTYGYQVDRERFVWPWRDWVIRAFNENKRYDQFAIEQIAGDLLDNPSDDQILATTFNRLHPQKVEGGSVPEEFRVEYVADRTQTFATAFLGLTFECSRCHDHKYDPLPQKDYYRLFAFFNNIDEAGLYSYFTPSVPTPTLKLLDDNARKSLAQLKQDVQQATRALQEIESQQQDKFLTWLEAESQESSLEKSLAPLAHLDFEKAVGGRNEQVEGVRGKAVRLTGDDAVSAKVGNFRRSQPFSISLWMRTPDLKERAVVFHRSRAWTDAGSRGYQMLLEDGRLSASLIHFWPGNSIRVRSKEAIPLKRWLHVAMTYDGSSRASGLSIFIDGKRAAVDVVRDKLTKNITGGGGNNIAIGERFRDRGFRGGDVDEFKVFQRELAPLEISQLAQRDRLDQTLSQLISATLKSRRKAKAEGQANDEADSSQLLTFYLWSVNAEWAQASTRLRTAREKLNQKLNGLQEIMVMRELDARRKTYRLNRGAYDAPAEAVTPGVPVVLPALPNAESLNRLHLARWLTDPQHPLTARVAVNRFWQACFGEGLVRTPEDFGSQGQPPTHPQLLDRLAYDFAHTGWNVKQLVKLMVMSSTYRQSTRTLASVIKQDPENRLLARASSFRWPAEMVRDHALAVSGLLVDRQGGPPAKPYDLDRSFKPMAPDKGDGLYRRSVYTYWKRTAPAPVMMTLDASKRAVCRVKREKTLSPLQSLVVLNGPQFVEASRQLAQHVSAKHSGSTADSLAEMFRRLTSRPPSAGELDVLTRLYDSQLKYFQADSKRAEQYLSVGAKPAKGKDREKLAALTSVANMLLSFDDCLMRR